MKKRKEYDEWLYVIYIIVLTILIAMIFAMSMAGVDYNFKTKQEITILPPSALHTNTEIAQVSHSHYLSNYGVK